MAKVTTSGGWSVSSDANLRLWLTELRDLLVSAGLVQTSDTGQINLTTVTWPGVNATELGYFVFRFNDTLQATAPVFLKLRFGRANSSINLSFGIEVGAGSDGAGNLTGTRQTIAPAGASGYAPGAGTYTSYAIHKDGVAALAFKVDGLSTANGSAGAPAFIVQRTVDNTGAPTGDGVMVAASSGAAGTNTHARVFRLRFSPTADIGAVLDGTAIGFLPGQLTDSRVGLAPQVFPHWIMLPKQRPMAFSASFVRGEISTGQQFSMALVGSTPRNYISIGSILGGTMYTPAAAGQSNTCILWED